MFRLAARRSLLIRAVSEHQAHFLDGLSTYMMKLGADNLVAPFDNRIDRRVAASPAVRSMRIRLQQTARLISDGLRDDLGREPGAALHLVNIGGGPAMDSQNALILLKQADRDLLQRPITIHVLDVDAAGASFGARALAALASGNGPLAGLTIDLRHQTYDWNDAEPLRALIKRLGSERSIIVASSEGALFEYGSDAAVVGNLAALHDGGSSVRFAVGSVTRADTATRRMLEHSPFKLILRGVERFSELAARGGFSVVRFESALMSDQVLLRPR